MKTALVLGALGASAAIATAGDVDPGIIFGSGNANGSFTIEENENVEIGLRGKLRYNENQQPENTFNWDGDDTYTFDPAGMNIPSNRSVFNFEFSVNTDANDPASSGNNLSDFTYLLTVSRLDNDGMGTTELFSFDPINDINPGTGEVQWDHAIGDNTTGNGDGTSIPNTVDDAAGYASLIASNNVAQQSWNLGFFHSQPQRAGTYFVTLTAFDGETTVVSTDITINVVPLPGAAWAGLGLIGAMGGVRVLRRR